MHIIRYSEVEKEFLPKEQDRLNYFFQKYSDKQIALRSYYKDGFDGVYFSQEELIAIFGRQDYQSSVKSLKKLGIKQQDYLSKYRKPLYIFNSLEKDFIGKLGSTNDRRLIARIESYRKLKKKELPSHAKAIYNNLKKAKFNISSEDVIKTYKTKYTKYRLGIEAHNGIKYSRKKKVVSLEEYLLHAESLIRMIIQFNKARGYDYVDYINVDKFSGRLHTLASYCPSELRKRISLSGKPVSLVDLKQTTPTILAHLIKKEYGNNHFSELIFSGGDIYSTLQEQYNYPLREYGKAHFYKMVFGHPGSNPSREFCEMFPIAGKYGNKVKYSKINQNPSKKWYSNLACVLQREEVKIFSEIWLALSSYQIPFLTAHDEIICRTIERDRVIEIMNSILGKYLSYYKLRPE